MNRQTLEEIEQVEESVIFEQADSQIVQVGFTTDKSTLLQIAKSAACMNNEGTFTITDEGLMYRDMDPSHVSMADISIPNSCFEKWSCIEEQKFALNLDEFIKLVNSLDAKGSVSLVIEKEKILVSQNGFTANIKTIETSVSDVPLPKIGYNSSLIINADQNINALDFKKTLNKISTVSDYVTINANDDRVILSGKGDNGNSEITFSKDDFEIKSREESKTTYNFEYLMPILKTLNKNSKVELEFSSMKPMRMRIQINKNIPFSRVDFYLAPRVEN